MDKLEKKIIKQENAIAETLKEFLKHFNRAWYSIKDPKEELEKFFDLQDSWDGIVYIFVKTKKWDFSMGYTMDVSLDDIQNMINYLKLRADVYLR